MDLFGDEQYDDHAAANLDAKALQALLLANDTLEDFLQELVIAAARDTQHHCGVTVPGRNGAQAYTVASSDELTSQLDELQYANGRGPCLEALRSQVPVFVTDMATETRWPPYPQHALQAGARSSLSYPLIAEGECVGALNFYATTPQVPDTDLQAHAAAIAGHAAGALALALRLADRDDLIVRLRLALSSRSTIDQAIGILMGQQRCTARTAFGLLRTASQHRNLKLRDIAAGIVAGIERDAEDSPPAPS